MSSDDEIERLLSEIDDALANAPESGRSGRSESQDDTPTTPGEGGDAPIEEPDEATTAPRFVAGPGPGAVVDNTRPEPEPAPATPPRVVQITPGRGWGGGPGHHIDLTNPTMPHGPDTRQSATTPTLVKDAPTSTPLRRGGSSDQGQGSTTATEANQQDNEDEEEPLTNQERRILRALEDAEKAAEKAAAEGKAGDAVNAARIAQQDPLNRTNLGQQLADDAVDFLPDGDTKRLAEILTDHAIRQAPTIPQRIAARAHTSWEVLSRLTRWSLYNGTAAAAGESLDPLSGGYYEGLVTLTVTQLARFAADTHWAIAAAGGASAGLVVWITIDQRAGKACRAKAKYARKSDNPIRRALNFWFVPGWIARIPLATIAAGTLLAVGVTIIQISTGATS